METASRSAARRPHMHTPDSGVPEGGARSWSRCPHPPPLASGSCLAPGQIPRGRSDSELPPDPPLPHLTASSRPEWNPSLLPTAKAQVWVQTSSAKPMTPIEKVE